MQVQRDGGINLSFMKGGGRRGEGYGGETCCKLLSINFLYNRFSPGLITVQAIASLQPTL